MEDQRTDECLVKLGETIRARRTAQGLSQDKLALMINSGQSYVYRIEAGKIKLGIDKLVRIADALGVQVRDLIEF